MYDQGVVLWAGFCGEDGLHGGRGGCVGTEAVDGFCGEGDGVRGVGEEGGGTGEVGVGGGVSDV